VNDLNSGDLRAGRRAAPGVDDRAATKQIRA
jgi:hypothetical protein